MRRSDCLGGLCVLFFLGSLYFAWAFHQVDGEYRACRGEYDDLRNMTESSGEEELQETLETVNPDYEAWLQVEGTAINYPVVRERETDYYLTHTFSKQEGVSGCLFVRQPGDIWDADNIIVFGHNMKDGSMLAGLKDMVGKSQGELPKIRLYGGRGTYGYQIIAGYTVGERELWPYVYRFSDEEARRTYAEEIREKSWIPYPVRAVPEKLLTLSTCYGGRRLIIQATRDKEED